MEFREKCLDKFRIQKERMTIGLASPSVELIREFYKKTLHPQNGEPYESRQVDRKVNRDCSATQKHAVEHLGG
jgi:hypothetical protein